MSFEKLTPLQTCARFANGVGRSVRYVHGPIKMDVGMPSGYREHLEVLQATLGDKRAPYFGPNLEYPREARSIWEGYRGIEEYAREVFPLEEYANGLRWMEDERGNHERPQTSLQDRVSSNASMAGSRPITPAGYSSPHHLTGQYTPRSHPEGHGNDFFVGSC